MPVISPEVHQQLADLGWVAPPAAPPPAPPPVVDSPGGGHVAPPGREQELAAKLAGANAANQTTYQGAAQGAAPPGAAVPLPPPGAGGGVARPAGMVPTTQETSTTGPSVSPEQRVGLQGARQESDLAFQLGQQGLAEQGAEARVQQAQANLDAFDRQQEADKAAAAHKEAEIEEAGKRAKAHAEYEMAASKGVDPNRWWHDKSVGGKIATGIFLALGGLSGTKDALDAFYKHRDQDIDAQKANIDSRKQLAEDAENHYALFIKHGMEPEQAQASAKVLADRSMEEHLKALAPETSGAMQKLALSKMIQEHAQQTQKDMLEEIKATAPVVTKKAASKYQAAVAAGGGAGDEYRAYAKKWVNGDQKIPLMSYGEWQKAMGGSGAGAAARAGAGEKPLSPRLVKTVAQLNTEEKAATKLQDLLRSGSSLSPSDRETAKALATELRGGGHTNIPEDPLTLFSFSGARADALNPVLQAIRDERETINKTPRGGEEPTADDGLP